MQGRIHCIISNRYTVRLDDGREVVCVAMGKLRLGQSPIVGDIVEVCQYDDQYGIESMAPRRNMLIRPLIANVDQALIVMSAANPEFSTTLVDRLIFLIAHQNIEPVLCITKTDLADPVQLRGWVDEYKKSGYRVIESTKKHKNGELEELFANKITVLTGQSGVGKSSLLNLMDASFEIKTQEISKALGRGKHTTRHVELMPVKGGWVADTPGFSSLDFSQITKAELEASVPDFKEWRSKCKFTDCLHDKEPHSAVKQGVADTAISAVRYEHYMECLALCKGKDVY